MSARAANKDAAFAVMDYLTSDAAAIAARTARAPGRPEPARVRRSRGREATPRSPRSARQLEHIVPMPNDPAMRAVWTPYSTALGEVLAGRAEPGTALLGVEQRGHRATRSRGDRSGATPAARLRRRGAARDHRRERGIRRSRATASSSRASSSSRSAARDAIATVAKPCRPCTARSSGRRSPRTGTRSSAIARSGAASTARRRSSPGQAVLRRRPRVDRDRRASSSCSRDGTGRRGAPPAPRPRRRGRRRRARAQPGALPPASS